MKPFWRRAAVVVITAHLMIFYSKSWYQPTEHDDFKPYYNVAAGIQSTPAIEERAWYSEKMVRILFYPFTLLGLEAGWRVMFCLNTICWLGLVKQLSGSLWGEIGFLLTIHPMLIILGVNNVQGVLLFLSLSPIGALVAGLLKPYYFGFAILHAIRIGMTVYQSQAGRIPLGTSPLPDAGHRIHSKETRIRPSEEAPPFTITVETPEEAIA